MSGSTVIIINEGLTATLSESDNQRVSQLVAELKGIDGVEVATTDDDDNDDG